MDNENKQQCIRCRKYFPPEELVDVHITMCIGHSHSSHIPVLECKSCLDRMLDDVKKEFGPGVVL